MTCLSRRRTSWLRPRRTEQAGGRRLTPENLPASTSVRLEIDRDKAQALGVPFTMISDTLTAAMGSRYVNDFPMRAGCSR